MKISVVMAAYNGAGYISEQLESIRHQSRKVDEIIVSDDYSTDDTAEIVGKFRKNCGEISVIYTNPPSHCGIDGNFAHGISLASGDVIFLCDQDDVWLEDRIELMMEVFEKSGKAVGTFCDSRIVDKDLKDLGYTHWQSRGFNNAEEIFSKSCNSFLKRVPAAGHDMAFSAGLRDMLLPFPDLPDCYDTWIGLVLYALDAWQECTALPLTLFRRHGNSATKSGVITGFTGKIKEAQKAVSDDTALWYAKLYGELIARVGEKIPPEKLHLLELRRKHSLARSAMNTVLRERAKLIWRELKSGNYHRFGRGYLNAVQDLLLRHPQQIVSRIDSISGSGK